MIPALEAGDGSALEIYPLRRQELQARAPDRSLPEELRDHTIADIPRVVLVRETARPTDIPYGHDCRQGDPVRGDDGHWHQTWLVIPPDAPRLAELKDKARGRVQALAADKTVDLSAIEVMAILEMTAYAADPRTPPPPAEYPVLVEIATSQAVSLPAAAAAVRARRVTLAERIAAVRAGARAARAAIDAATSGADIQAAIQSFEAV